MTIEDIIYGEIEKLQEELEGLETDSKEYETKARRLDSLMDKAIDMGKFNVEREDKLNQLDEEKKDRVVKNVLQGLGIGLPLLVTIWGTHKSIKFEREGTITTIMGRGFIQKLLPKK